jgi:pimeloyl-ACP methyl ester carboxylesterase
MTTEPARCAAVGPVPAEWTTRDGLRLIGNRWGDPAAPTVVFLHGIGQSRHSWRAAAKAVVAAGLSAVTVDSRGHGDSDWAPDGDYARQKMLLDTEAVLADITGPVVLVGFSLGGDGCLMRAAASPARAAGVVLVDVAPHVEPDGVDPVQTFLEASVAGFAELYDAAAAVAAMSGAVADPAGDYSGLARHLRRDEARSRWFWKWDPSHFGDPDLALRERELNDAARAIDAPMMLVRGALSSMLSDESVERFLAVCPTARYVNVTDAGHGASGSTNDAFARAIVEFATEALR